MPESHNADKDLVPEGLMPIRTVASLTGVNPVTLRAWERRYNLITPHRTPKGHRLYSGHNVEQIRQILELLEQGISISQVKPLLGGKRPEFKVGTPVVRDEVWHSYQQVMLRAIEAFDEFALDQAYNDALSLYPVEIVSQRLTTIMLRILGERWQDSETGIAQEHFFSVYLRNKLGARVHHTNRRTNAPLLLLACLPGEFHELGLLFFSLASADFGFRVLLLGANTPLDQLPGVLEKRHCAGVVLSCTTRPSRGVLDGDLAELVNGVDVPVYVGGSCASRYRGKIESAGAICLDKAIGKGLQLISDSLSSRS
jgi:MerR family transcriptional regulator, light-induced transcriptional regulator